MPAIPPPPTVPAEPAPVPAEPGSVPAGSALVPAGPALVPAGPALRTDRYELTMLEAARRSGVADHRAVFEVFARDLPAGRRYGVLAGVGRAVEAIVGFRFDDRELAWLAEAGVVEDDTLDHLAAYRFAGTVTGYAEGELYFPGSPVLTVEASFADAVLLETVVLSILNHDTAIAGAAARMREAAGTHTLVDMGARRTHEEAAVAAARAAWLCGFDATSDLEAGRRHGIPTLGTAAHAFTLAHTDEEAAFRAQLETLGLGTTLLVDTYDTNTGLRRAVDAARALGAAGPGAVRIDSGDLLVETRRARRLLDEWGADATRIVVSGDLDEEGIDRLERADGGRAPVDAYGVGTRLVTGSGAPTAGFVYKLVAVADAPGRHTTLRPVAKRSAAKATIGGRKRAWRALDAEGRAVAEVVRTGPDRRTGEADGAGWTGVRGLTFRPLQVTLVVDGRPTDGALDPEALDAGRAHHRRVRAELAPDARQVTPAAAAIPTLTDPAPAQLESLRRGDPNPRGATP